MPDLRSHRGVGARCARGRPVCVHTPGRPGRRPSRAAPSRRARAGFADRPARACLGVARACLGAVHPCRRAAYCPAACAARGRPGRGLRRCGSSGGVIGPSSVRPGGRRQSPPISANLGQLVANPCHGVTFTLLYTRGRLNLRRGHWARLSQNPGPHWHGRLRDAHCLARSCQFRQSAADAFGSDVSAGFGAGEEPRPGGLFSLSARYFAVV